MSARHKMMHRHCRLCCFWCVAGGILFAWVYACWWASLVEADEPTIRHDPTGRYEFRREHDPNGIGKFYMGREIARVMGYPAAAWLERPEREQEERTSQMVAALGVREGMSVADVGAGSGRITVMLAAAVGDRGIVYAVDVQPQMLELIADKVNRLQLKNVELVLASAKSPKLKPQSIDLALLVDVYHELEYPYEVMLELSRALKPGGRVVLVEFRREDPTVPIKLVHKMTEAQVKRELGLPEFGWKWKETLDILPWQHIIVFERVLAEESKP
ncbi:MAG: methyltransferase type 11 [Planctomycetaceae bacterium]|nr:MAG: methyltransferase type 11 [Planctomycetaceae bacterium]